MDSTTPLDLNALFEGFDDTSYHHYIQQPYSTASTSTKDLHGKATDGMVHSLLFNPSTSFLSSSSSSIQQNYHPSPMINTPCLDAFTPTLTGAMGDSPTLATPFMDPTGGSHFMGASGMDLDCIQNYFTPQLATAPDTNFSSVDPSDLELGQVHDPQGSLVLDQPSSLSSSGVPATADDSLFPLSLMKNSNFTTVSLLLAMISIYYLMTYLARTISFHPMKLVSLNNNNRFPPRTTTTANVSELTQLITRVMTYPTTMIKSAKQSKKRNSMMLGNLCAMYVNVALAEDTT
ncbi:unnamed protein product [Absidia cylindrospora]